MLGAFEAAKCNAHTVTSGSTPVMAHIVMMATAFVWSFICMPHTFQDDAAAKRVHKSPCYQLPCNPLCLLLQSMPLPPVKLEVLSSPPKGFWSVIGQTQWKVFD